MSSSTLSTIHAALEYSPEWIMTAAPIDEASNETLYYHLAYHPFYTYNTAQLKRIDVIRVDHLFQQTKEQLKQCSHILSQLNAKSPSLISETFQKGFLDSVKRYNVLSNLENFTDLEKEVLNPFEELTETIEQLQNSLNLVAKEYGVPIDQYKTDIEKNSRSQSVLKSTILVTKIDSPECKELESDRIDRITVAFLTLLLQPKTPQHFKEAQSKSLEAWDAALKFCPINNVLIQIDEMRQWINGNPTKLHSLMGLIDFTPTRPQAVTHIDSVGAVELPKTLGPYGGLLIEHRKAELDRINISESIKSFAERTDLERLKSLFPSLQAWERLPEYDNCPSSPAMILNDSMSAPIMRGIDHCGRHFIALTIPDEEHAVVISRACRVTTLYEALSGKLQWAIWNHYGLAKLSEPLSKIDTFYLTNEEVICQLRKLIRDHIRTYDPKYQWSAVVDRAFCHLFSTIGRTLKLV